MDNFVVSARKYRPETFDTVVGQKSITNTLKNAIKNNHLAQSFLFCGPRGVGKTTCARILAKTINCENLSENLEACNKCKSCESFNTSNSFNVHELDAASNNSVEDIRNLVDQVRIPPHIGKYKIYIIDEVHMLSAAAFNAFLKTLEEPPHYAKFILATTEKHKIIPTILSRCQIFDFKRIKVDDIAKHLHYVAQKENVTADDEALHLIAQKADGALRDALSIFDQIVSFTGNDVTYQAVVDNLNILDYDYFFRITDHIIDQNATGILLLINEIIDKGFEGAHFITGFGDHLRNLLVSKNPQTVKLLETSESVRKRYSEQAAKCDESFIINALEILSGCDTNYKIVANKKLHLELTLVKMASYQKKKSQPRQSSENSILIPPKSTSKSSIEAKPAKEAPEPKKYTPKENITVQEVKEKDEAPKVNSENIKLKRPLKISGSGAGPKKPEKEPEEHEELNPDTDKDKKVHPEEFYKYWKEMAENIKEESHSLFLAFTKNKPRINDENQIEVFVDNMVQESEINEKKIKILGFLRKKLDNKSVSLTIRIVNNDNSNQKAYLPEEKFKLLSDKNPKLITLKEKLNLDFY